MLTIAIPTYNRGPILIETLRRLEALSTPAGEIVVVDQTPSYPPEIEAELEERHAAGTIRWIRLPVPSIPAAMNRALLEARFPKVLFIDDDVDPPANLTAAHEAAHRSPAIWAVVGQVLQPGEVPQHFAEETLRAGEIPDIEFRFNHDGPCMVRNVLAGNLSVDRERALQIGGFDENFVGAAYRFESDFALRLAAAGGSIAYEPEAGLRHLRVPTGGTRALGDHRKSASPAHSAGDYYFARFHAPSFLRYALRRFIRNVGTKYHLSHPWAIPPKSLGELRGLLLALRLSRRGRRLLERPGIPGPASPLPHSSC
jgi:GT2 family glycosyltransferase